MLADLHILGGSFNQIKGHDLIEALGYKTFTLVGPNYYNQKSVVEDLQELNVIQKISNRKEQEFSLKKLNYKQIISSYSQELLTDKSFIAKVDIRHYQLPFAKDKMDIMLANLAGYLLEFYKSFTYNRMFKFQELESGNKFFIEQQQALDIHLTLLNNFDQQN